MNQTRPKCVPSQIAPCAYSIHKPNQTMKNTPTRIISTLAVAALEIARDNPDGVMVVMPSDHVMPFL